METPKKTKTSTDGNKQTSSKPQAVADDSVELDGTPVLDERDLEENNLTDEEADNIEWDDQQDLDEEAAIAAEEEDDGKDDDESR